MSELAIDVQKLSKKYFIGGVALYRNLRDNITDSFKLMSNLLKGKLSYPEISTFWALKDINFDVKWGEVVGIVGYNGSGKSTLLKILSRITEPTGGEARIYGRTGSLLEVGSGFHPELTGRENIYVNGSILGMKKIEIDKNFDEIVNFADVEKFIDTPVKHYSSGMYVRLAFAVAAHLNPEIMIIDEVLAVGDMEFQKKCVDRMKNISNKGKAVLVVTHSMITVKSLCSRAIMLEKGQIKIDGTVDDVIKAYTGHSKVDSIEKMIGENDYIVKGDRIKVKRIRLLNGVENSFSVHWQQPVEVLVEINVIEPTEEISFGSIIKKLDDTIIFTVHHDDYGTNSRWNLKPGNYNIRFTLNNILKPGIYKLGIIAHHQHYRNILFHIEAINIEVLEYSNDGKSPLLYNHGFVTGSAKWFEPEGLLI
jgi:lipopolysaccharide transport system ATP-binding protein